MAYEQIGHQKLQQYCQNVHFSDIDWHFYIISWHKYSNVLQHEQDKFMLCIKQHRLLKLVHFKREYNYCNEITPFSMFGRISGGYGIKCITQSEVFNESNEKL